MPQIALLDREPTIHASSFIAPSAEIIGDVTVGAESSIWYGCVLRGDINRIVIGARTNIQDASVIHLSDDFAAIVGDEVTVSGCILHVTAIRGHRVLRIEAMVPGS